MKSELETRFIPGKSYILTPVARARGLSAFDNAFMVMKILPCPKSIKYKLEVVRAHRKKSDSRIVYLTRKFYEEHQYEKDQ